MALGAPPVRRNVRSQIMIPEKTKVFLSVLKRHPLVFAAVYIPVICSVVISSAIYRVTCAYCLPLLWCFFVSLFLIDGVKKGQLTDNHGTAIRHQTPVRFWGKVCIWSAFYLFAIVWCIGFAMQERRREMTEPDGPANGSQPVRSETHSTSSAAGSRR